jgi:hypothetical protein
VSRLSYLGKTAVEGPPGVRTNPAYKLLLRQTARMRGKEPQQDPTPSHHTGRLAPDGDWGGAGLQPCAHGIAEHLDAVGHQRGLSTVFPRDLLLSLNRCQRSRRNS